MSRLIFDLETRSELDVKEVGPHKYAAHPSTEIMHVGYKIDDAPAKVWLPLDGDPMPSDLEKALKKQFHSMGLVVAHNAEFELEVWNNQVLRYQDKYKYILLRDNISCTAARAAARGYPRKLEVLAEALRLATLKDKEGHRVMLKLTKPRSAWYKDKTAQKWHDNEIDFLIVAEYCRTDVEVEALVDKLLPELGKTERQLWELTCDINKRGIKVDIDLINKVIFILEWLKKDGLEEFYALTGGQVKSPTELAQFHAWLKQQGCSIDNLQAQTVIDTLSNPDISPQARRGLELRQLLGKSSTSKYEAFKNRAMADGIVRDLLVYSAAVPTARWTGSGVQPQNFPRGTVKDTETVLNYIRLGDPQLIQMVYKNPLAALSSCLRNMIIPHKVDTDFVCADFAQIETRALFWLCDETRGIEAFANGDDLYKEMAADIFNIDYLENVTPDQRFVGKESILGCGYGMGAPKFVSQCAAKNVKIPPELGKKAVYAYRNKFKKVPEFWQRIERACLLAVNKNVTVKVNDKISVTKKVNEHWLSIRLPSGREMFYPYVDIKNKETHWGEMKATISYMGVDSKTKRWQREYTYGGKLTENICQGLARDLMAKGMLNCEQDGFVSSLTVHDELLANNPNKKTVEEFVAALTKLPPWAAGFPLKAEGWSGPRYKK